MCSERFGVIVYGCEPDEAACFEELAPRVGFVPTITSDAVSASTVIALPGNRCASVGHKSVVSAPTLRALQRAGVEYVSTRSIGVDHIDLAAAERLGITVENVAYAPDGVADFTVMMILMAIRDLRQLADAVDRHDFRLHRTRGRDLRDLTVGVVGVGQTGSAVIRRLRGFGCRVLACTNSPRAVAATHVVTFDELLRASDVVTLHVPLDASTHHLVGRNELDAMKAGAVLVNTGRGALVDTAALLVALERGRLGGAALDVLEGEEGIFYFDHSARGVDHPLLRRLQRLPNVILTPHTAYYTRRALRDTVENTLVNCLSFERNRASGETQSRDLVRGLLGGA
jgi:D-specific alpha-keto acid dehydrogenase